MFSALYLALLLVLAALMARGVAFGYQDKSEDPRWRSAWTWCTTIGSLLIPLLIGVGLGDLLVGLPINSSQDFTGNFFDLLTPYGIWTGLTLVGLCLLHGATFLKLKTTGVVRQRARSLRGAARVGRDRAGRSGSSIWTRAVAGGANVPDPVQILAVLAVDLRRAAGGLRAPRRGGVHGVGDRDRRQSIGSIFINLYPNVMISSTNAAYNLTVNNSASGHYALKVMTIVAVVFVPLVLAYQGWSFHVFRARVKAPVTQAPAGQEPPTAPAARPAGPADVH